MKKLLKKILPKKFLNHYHLQLAKAGAKKYGQPSEELLVIGITGTSGKSSTTYILREMLEAAGYTVGSLSTVDFYIAGKQHMNDKKMTMLGRTKIQQYLRKMVSAGCDIAIVETTSEGYLQHRHRYINYDMMLLTNLYPEHIDSHGSYENYKKAKHEIFKYVTSCKNKTLKGETFPKTAIVNGAVKEADEFLDLPFDQQVVFVRNDEELFVESKRLTNNLTLLLGKDINSDKNGLHFDVGNKHYDVHMYGEHNVSNILGAMAICKVLNISTSKIEAGLKKVHGVPGRLEFIPEAEKYQFQTIVDYAFEPVAMDKLYTVVKLLKPKRIVHVLGSTGGGRDIERRFTVGEYVGKNADIVIVTDEDPYDDDPMDIIKDVASAVEKTGKTKDKSLFTILSRKQAIQKAIDLAKPGDMVLVTGKGSEQAMVVKGKLIPWDDRKQVKNALKHKK